MKKKLILHVGTGKTGTTTLQKHLALNRPALSTAGILYPDLTSMVGGQHFYHNGLASARIGEDEVDPAALAALEMLAADREHAVVLLSAEVLGTRVAREAPRGLAADVYRARRRAFVRRLAQQLDRFDVHPVIVLRRQDTFVESRYKQFVKRFPEDGSRQASGTGFATFRDNSTHLGDYDFRVAVLRDYLGEPTVLRYEDGDIIDTFTNALGLPHAARTVSEANVSAPAALSDWMQAMPVGSVKEREGFAAAHASEYLEAGARTFWESQEVRDAYLELFAHHTYGGTYFPEPRPIPPRTPLSSEKISSLSTTFGQDRRERAVANRLARFAA